MKWTYLYFIFFSLNLAACNPFNLNEKQSPNKIKDDAKGENKFDFPDIEDLDEIDLDELKDSLFSKDCSKYKKASSFSLFPKSLSLQGLRNCLEKSIDESLKPICEQEKDLEELLDYYENQKEYDKVDELEEQLYNLEEAKYQIANQIYDLADAVDDIDENLEDDIDNIDSSGVMRLIKPFVKIYTTSELSSVTRLLDRKALIACPGRFDLKKIKNRK